MFGRHTRERLSHFWQRPKRRSIEEFKTWASEHAVMLEPLPLNGAKADIEQLAFLDKLLEGKRIVYLGEEDHWIHEKSEYRLLMLRYLVSRGWRFIGEELGWSDGLRIDHYLETGDETVLSRIATYGYKGALRTDRDDRPTGILKDSAGNYPTEAFAAEQLRVTQALRELSISDCRVASAEGAISGSRCPVAQRLHYFGFDIDALAGGGYDDLAELLRTGAASLTETKADSPAQWREVIDSLEVLRKRVPGETVEEEIARLTSLLAMVEARQLQLVEVLGEEGYANLRQWTLTLCDSLEFVRVANPATSYPALNKAMAQREEAMYRHVQFVLSQMGPDDKLVLMGHNRHLAKDSDHIKNPGASSPGGQRVPSLGTFLNRLLPGQVFSIWMLQEQGKGSQPFDWLSSEYVSVPGSLNAILGEVGEAFLLPTVSADLRASLLKRPLKIVGIYNAIFQTTITSQADAIFFLRSVNPLEGHKLVR